jgi:hypothetical protein
VHAPQALPEAARIPTLIDKQGLQFVLTVNAALAAHEAVVPPLKSPRLLPAATPPQTRPHLPLELQTLAVEEGLMGAAIQATLTASHAAHASLLCRPPDGGIQGCKGCWYIIFSRRGRALSQKTASDTAQGLSIIVPPIRQPPYSPQVQALATRGQYDTTRSTKRNLYRPMV